MHRPQSILISSILVAALLSFSLGWFFAKNIGTPTSSVKIPSVTQTSSGNSATLQIPNIDSVWKKLQDFYYDAVKLDLVKLEYHAVKGFVAGIGDPYTVFMTPTESTEFENGLEGELEGIGAELEVRDGKLVVVTPLKRSPAERAGVKAGDIIFKINGELAGEMTLYEAIRKIRGPKGTSVTLTLIRETLPQPLELKIVREQITIESITLKKLDGDIFHLIMNQFNDHTKTEFHATIQKILLEGTKGLILDLRGNGGGYLDIAIDILSEFLPGEKVGAIIKKRDSTKNELVKTNGMARLVDIPIVVLVDKGSASASEILAGAIQDYKRGIVIGEKTFGKGSVQELTKLQDGSTLRYTIAKWFTPLDRSIDGVGISPDREVKITDEDRIENRDPQLNEAIRHLNPKSL